MLKRKGKFLAIFVIIISSLLLLSGCLGEIGSGSDEEDLISQGASLKGQLKDFNEEFAASGLVILSKDGKEIDRKYADANGFVNESDQYVIEGGGFEFANLEDGEYTLSIYKLGYETQTLNVPVSDGEARVLDPIILEPETDFANTSKANSISHITVNNVPDSVNKSLLVEALNLAVDNDHIINEIYSDMDIITPTRILPPATAGDNQIDSINNYNLSEANSIISENGIQAELTFYYYDGSDANQNHLDLIDYLKDQWSQLDNLTVDFISYNDNDTYSPGEYNLIKSGWILDNPDPLFNLKEIANHTGASESAVDKINEAKLKIDNEAEAMELIYDAEKIMVDNGDFIVLYHYLN